MLTSVYVFIVKYFSALPPNPRPLRRKCGEIIWYAGGIL